MLSKNEIRALRDLHQKKFRVLEKKFICEGEKVVQELLRSDWEPLHIYALPEWVATQSESISCPLTEVTPAELERISALVTPNRVLAVVKIPETQPQVNYQAPGLSLLLDGVKDPGNLGTLLRIADWFGVKQVICAQGSVELYNPKTVQATMGSLFRMTCLQAPLEEMLRGFREQGVSVYAAAMEGDSVYELEWNERAALLLGSESHGISETLLALSDRRITIPHAGGAESLNVAVAAGICCAFFKASSY